MRVTEGQFAWPWWKWSLWLMPKPATGAGDDPCHGGWQTFPRVKLGKNKNLNWQPPHCLQGHQRNSVQVSCGLKAKVSPFHRYHSDTGAATHHQRWCPSAHHITESVLFPQRGNKIFGFKTGNGAASVLHLLKSLGVLPPALPAGQSGSLRGA